MKINLDNYNPPKPKDVEEMTLEDKVNEFRCVLTTLNMWARQIISEVEKQNNDERKPF